QKWPQCTTIGKARGQGFCGSCWGCKPYSTEIFKGRKVSGCKLACTNKNYSSTYRSDKRFIKYKTSIWSANVQQIQTEIMENGPVQASAFLISFCTAQLNILSDEFIDSINKVQSFWKAGKLWPENTTEEFLRNLSGTVNPVSFRFEYHNQILHPPQFRTESDIPKNFDLREKWPNCTSIGKVTNQGKCGSCWALAAASVLTDRFCIMNKGNVNFEFSTEDILTCCGKNCLADVKDYCRGGRADQAWKFLVQTGCVSGGYASKEGCKPYSTEIFEGKIAGCKLACINKDYPIEYKQDKRFAKFDKIIWTKNVQQIQTEIMNNGPVEAFLEVYRDFESYEQGIYFHTKGDVEVLGHSVKLIGWGVEKDLPYWLGINSWGDKWGMKGTFKILRGNDECSIESMILSGVPNLGPFGVRKGNMSCRVLLLALALILISIFGCTAELRVLSDEFINSINKEQAVWRAGKNWPENSTEEFLMNLGGSVDPRSYKDEHREQTIDRPQFRRPADIPVSFDARIQWPQCESINKTRNQGGCSNSWAFVAASVITDRVCIASNGTIKTEFSIDDILTCCGEHCLADEHSPCGGGRADKAWEFWRATGIVSGGIYNPHQGCKPYLEETLFDTNSTQCKFTCTNKSYTVPYKKDKVSGKNITYIWSRNVAEIQMEIMNNGPVEAFIEIYEDFEAYKEGSFTGLGHSVKIIGWGVENGADYWLGSNSWGKRWGFDGFFKILRGKDECNIETAIMSGIPNLYSPHFLSDEFIDSINKAQTRWRAGKNWPSNATGEFFRGLGGVIDESKDYRDEILREFRPEVYEIKNIPESFDASKKWPHCESSINSVKKQGNCGSCWAVQTAATITDRLCISTNASGCKPYSKSAYEDHKASKCIEYCVNGRYGKSYFDDKKFGKKVYMLYSRNMTDIQAEIMLNGPVETGLKIYQDFLSYTDVGVILTLSFSRAQRAIFHDDDFINFLNSGQSLWKAKKNFPENTTMEAALSMCGARLEPELIEAFSSKSEETRRRVFKHIPESFDSRKKWPFCDTIQNARNQGFCGSCWKNDSKKAVSAAGAISDRICIRTKGKKKEPYSAEDIMSCCTECVANVSACNGGYSGRVWRFWAKHGVVTGGEGCKPYSPLAFFLSKANRCKKECHPGYHIEYENDKVYGKNINVITSESVPEIQSEIMLNGPVSATIKVYEDFFAYSEGVYFHKGGAFTKIYHAVKIIGWGVENDIPYWLATNSWGDDVVLMLSFSRAEKPKFHDDDFIKSINERQSLWKAGRNFGENITMDHVKNLCGSMKEKLEMTDKYRRDSARREDRIFKKIPETFDARKRWPRCKTIGKIQSQGICGSDWAVQAAAVMSDRICIRSKGAINTPYSAEDLLTCCTECFHPHDDGCQGGRAYRAWEFMKRRGMVTGGGFDEPTIGCKPYSKKIYFHGEHADCESKCTNPNYSVPYYRDKQYVQKINVIANGVVEEIQSEIMLNGPVQASLKVYYDFFLYQEGVYFHGGGEFAQEYHAVKILGWGVENGQPYWLVANSWGEEWGKMKGFFKIRRGNN
ncbi:Peptidase C1 and/or Propeptide C1 domain containing protein, partial [Asbolus verrucosus]